MQSESSSPVRDPSRLQALNRTGLLDSPSEESFDRLTRLAVKILRVPVALVSLVDKERQFFKSCVGLSEPWASQRETPLSHSFCQHTIASHQPLIIEDARTHPLVLDNLAITDLNVIAYAGIPLVLSDGSTIGSFCAIDSQPRRWTEDEIDILHELAASVITEIELRLVGEEAKAAISEREALLSIASHELKTPIPSIIGYAQLLERRASVGYTLSERDIKAITTIRTQGERVNRMLNTILDRTMLETGQISLNLVDVDLKTLVTRAVTDMSLNAPAHQITLIASDSPIMVHGDELQLEQVISNLLGNAIKYSPSGGAITIEISRNNDHAQLLVKDSGIGIPADALHGLFKRFARVRTSQTQNISGLGLGLYIVKEIITRHGGTITVTSEEGTGSTFTVLLPLNE